MQARHIPIHPGVELERRHADGTVAVIGAVLRVLEFGLHHRHTAEQTQAADRFAEHVELHALVDLQAFAHVARSGRIDDFGVTGARLLDTVNTQRGAVGAHIDLDARFNLLGACGCIGLAAADDRPFTQFQRRRRPLGQAFDAVGVHRHMLPRLEHQAVDRRGDRLVVVGRARAARVVVALHHHLLATGANGQQQAVIEEAKGVGNRRAAYKGLRGDFRVAEVRARGVAWVVQGRWRAGSRVVDIGDGLATGKHISVARLGPGPGQAEVEAMAHRTGLELAVQPRHQAAVVFFVGDGRAAGGGVAEVVGQGHRRITPHLTGVLDPACRVRRPVVVQVVLGAQHAQGVFQVGTAPARRVVGVGRRRIRDVGGGAGEDRVAPAVDVLLLVHKVTGHTQRVATVVQAHRKQLRTLVLIIDAGIAFALGQVHPRAKLMVFTKALANVQVLAHAAIAADVGAQAAQRQVIGALGLQVHAAANPRTGGAHAVDKGIRALEHFDPFQGVGGDDLAWQDAVQTVVGHIVAIQGQAANHEGLRLVGIPRRLAHGRVIEQHIADGFGLLVADQFLGVGRHAERHVHDVLVAQHPQLATACHLAAGVHRGQGAWRGCVGADVGGAQFQGIAVLTVVRILRGGWGGGMSSDAQGAAQGEQGRTKRNREGHGRSSEEKGNKRCASSLRGYDSGANDSDCY